jgi:hypothetical protein
VRYDIEIGVSLVSPLRTVCCFAPYLSCMAAPRSFTSPAALFDAAFATGTLATIATGGALLGLGWREGEAGRVFRLAGRALLERFGFASSAAPLSSVALGYLHHLTVATVWGVLLALCVLPFKGTTRVLVTVVAAAGYVLLVTSVVPAPLRIGYAVTGSLAGAVPIGAALAVALLGGVWLAAADGNGETPGETPSDHQSDPPGA